MLGVTAGCTTPANSDPDSGAQIAPLGASKTVELPRTIASEPGRQGIVDNLVRAELLLERFEQVTERAPVEGLKLGSHEIYPELDRIGDELLTDLVNSELRLTDGQSAVLADSVKLLFVVARFLKNEEIRPTVSFSHVRSHEKNVALLYQARASLRIAKSFFAEASPVKSF